MIDLPRKDVLEKKEKALKPLLRREEEKKANYLILLVLQLQNSVKILMVFSLTHLHLRPQVLLQFHAMLFQDHQLPRPLA